MRHKIHKTKPKNFPKANCRFEVDSSWRSIELVEEQIKAIKQVDKDYGCKSTIYITKERPNWYTIYTKVKFK